jgi:hypothetical protein
MGMQPDDGNEQFPRWLRNGLATGLLLFWAFETHADIVSKDIDVPWIVNIAAGVGLLYFFQPQAERLAKILSRWKAGEDGRDSRIRSREDNE